MIKKCKYCEGKAYTGEMCDKCRKKLKLVRMLRSMKLPEQKQTDTEGVVP